MKTLVLPPQGVWVRSLVGELRSHMPHGMAKKKKKGRVVFFRKIRVLLY